MDWFATFKVRQAATIIGAGIALLAAAALLAVVTAYVLWQPEARADGDWAWTAALGFAAACGGCACLVVGFIKLCVNVEYLVREAVDRRGG